MSLTPPRAVCDIANLQERLRKAEEVIEAAEAVDKALDPLWDALMPFIDGGGELHDPGCPQDDTCECPEINELSIVNTRVSDARMKFHDVLRLFDGGAK